MSVPRRKRPIDDCHDAEDDLPVLVNETDDDADNFNEPRRRGAWRKAEIRRPKDPRRKRQIDDSNKPKGESCLARIL